MSDHDKFCPIAAGGPGDRCWMCAVTRKARADERERIAVAIYLRLIAWDEAWPALAKSGAKVGPGAVRAAYGESVHIARNALRAGGSDE